MANEELTDGVRCRVCGRTRAEHREQGLLHRFTEKGGLEKRAKGDTPQAGAPVSQKAPYAAPTGDPVLRFVMIEKGLITPEDLEAAESTLRSLGVLSHVRVTRELSSDPTAGAGSPAERGMRDPGGPAGSTATSVAQQQG